MMVLAAACPSSSWFVELQFEESALPELTQMGNPETARRLDGAGRADSGLNTGLGRAPGGRSPSRGWTEGTEKASGSLPSSTSHLDGL